MSQIMSVSDEMLNKRRSSLAMERTIETFPQGKHWQMGSNGLASFFEKAIGLASAPLVALAGFIFLCFAAGMGLFLAICRFAGTILRLLTPSSKSVPPTRTPR